MARRTSPPETIGAWMASHTPTMKNLFCLSLYSPFSSAHGTFRQQVTKMDEVCQQSNKLDLAEGELSTQPTYDTMPPLGVKCKFQTVVGLSFQQDRFSHICSVRSSLESYSLRAKGQQVFICQTWVCKHGLDDSLPIPVLFKVDVHFVASEITIFRYALQR